MNSSDLAQIILESNGKIVSLVFVKKDGTHRAMVGRLGVQKHLKGGDSTLDSNKYITLFDLQKNAYRAVNRETIISLKAQGETFSTQVTP